MNRFDEANEYRVRLLTSPGERAEVDYKAAQPFNPHDDFGLKLIKHIQGMANSGGGVIVIGYREERDKLPSPDPAMDDAVRASYEPTKLAQAVNRSIFRGQEIRLSVHQVEHPESHVHYPELFVDANLGTPIVCRTTRPDGAEKPVLREGAVYIRRPDASTSEASTPQDYRGLIRRAQQANREAFLDELRELVGARSPTDRPSPADRLRERLDRGRRGAFEDDA